MTMKAPDEGSKKFLFSAIAISNLISLSSGITIGWTSPVNAKLRNADNPLGISISDEQDSWISSLMPLGAIFGPFLAGFLSNRLGRKLTLIICCGTLFLISHLILAFAKTIYLFYLARFLAGFAFGGVFTILHHFYAEISVVSVRGMVSSSVNVFLLLGILFSYAVGPYTSIMWFNLACAVWPVIFIILFVIFVPESPYFLVSIGKFDDAAASLRKYRQNSEGIILKELEVIKLSMEESAKKNGSFIDIFRSKGLTKALIISMSLLGFQQFSGINVVLFNAQPIFESTGVNFSAEISSIIIGVVQLSSSFTTPFLVDRHGRKFLLVVSTIGMLIAEVPLGLYFYLVENNKDVSSISWLPLTCLIGYILAYNFGFGVLPWTVSAEIFPAEVKSSAATITTSFHWILAFLLTKFFNSLTLAIGQGGSFWLFSGFCALAIPFLLFYVIETTGRSLQEIQDILCK